MSQNVNIPIQYAYVYGIDGTNNIYPCVIHAARSRAGKVMTFHVHLQCGANYSLVPLNKIIHVNDAKAIHKTPIQSWDCFSDSFECHVYDHFKFRMVLHKKWGVGEYICTFDWQNNEYSDMTEEFKQGHMIKLDNGNYGIFPNNELLWHDKTWTGDVNWDEKIPKLCRQKQKDYPSAENF